MKVSEMEVGESGFIVPWHVKPIFCLAGYVSLYIRKDISVDCKSGGTSKLLIERGPYGIKIDRLEYLNERSSVKFDIQHLRIQGIPEIPQDVEWVVSWLGEEDRKLEEGRLERIERKVDRLLDGILSRGRD